MKKILIKLIFSMAAVGLSGYALAQKTLNCKVLDTFYDSQPPLAESAGPNPKAIGNTTAYVMPLSLTPGGEKVAHVVVVRSYLGLENLTPGPNGMFLQSSTYTLPEGTLVTFGATDFDTEVEKTKHERAIIGGTGKYAGIQGSLILETLGNKTQKITLNAYVPCPLK